MIETAIRHATGGGSTYTCTEKYTDRYF